MAKNWKDIENRTWSLTRYFRRSELPVRIYLHASLTPTSTKEIEFIKSKLTAGQRREFEMVDWKKYRGYIIGEITITDEVTNDEIGMVVTHSPWFFGPMVLSFRMGNFMTDLYPVKGSLVFLR